MRCVVSLDCALNPYAMAVHQAAHAVASCMLGLTVVEIAASNGGRHGRFVAEGAPRVDERSTGAHRTRHLAEKRAIVLLAGAAAQVRGTGTVAHGYECDDNEGVAKLLDAVEPDDLVTSAWFTYLQGRTRVFVENGVTWGATAELTGALLLRSRLLGDEVSRIVSACLARAEVVRPDEVVEVPVLGRWPVL